jgi:SAM-dependent methyltransferase
MPLDLSPFYSHDYQVHNAARLAHLASLGLPLDNRTVLEAGSGPGDHTGFYLERGCRVLATDARPECVEALRARHPKAEVAVVDWNFPPSALGQFEVVHCYGILYHLQYPQQALDAMAGACQDLMVLETCVAPGPTNELVIGREDQGNPTQSFTGWACRPTRLWVFEQLRQRFPFVYTTRTQPNHQEFPIDWTLSYRIDQLIRAVFVASRRELALATLVAGIPERQIALGA